MSVLTSVTAPARHGDELGASGTAGLPRQSRRGTGNFPPLPPASWVSPPPSAGTGPSSPRPLGRAPLAPESPRSSPRTAPREPELTSKSRSEPVVVAVQQLVEDPGDVFRVQVPAVSLGPQRLVQAARRGRSRRQPLALGSSLPPSPSSALSLKWRLSRNRPRGRREEGRGLGPRRLGPRACGRA